jgi:hypothetical protein
MQAKAQAQIDKRNKYGYHTILYNSPEAFSLFVLFGVRALGIVAKPAVNLKPPASGKCQECDQGALAFRCDECEQVYLHSPLSYIVLPIFKLIFSFLIDFSICARSVIPQCIPRALAFVTLASSATLPVKSKQAQWPSLQRLPILAQLWNRV